jgi:hypothetical protein
MGTKKAFDGQKYGLNMRATFMACIIRRAVAVVPARSNTVIYDQNKRLFRYRGIYFGTYLLYNPSYKKKT